MNLVATSSALLLALALGPAAAAQTAAPPAPSEPPETLAPTADQPPTAPAEKPRRRALAPWRPVRAQLVAAPEKNPEPPQRGLALTVGLYQQLPFDDGYGLFAEGTSGTLAAEVSYDLSGLTDWARVGVVVGIGYEQRGHASEGGGGSYGSGRNLPFDAGLDTLAGHASLLLRFRPRAAIQPFVSVGGGLARSTLTLDGARSAALDAQATGGFARGGVGVRWIPRPLIIRRAGAAAAAFAFGLELGGTLAGKRSFTTPKHQHEGKPGDRITTEAVGLGDLNPSALFAGLTSGILF